MDGAAGARAGGCLGCWKEPGAQSGWSRATRAEPQSMRSGWREPRRKTPCPAVTLSETGATAWSVCTGHRHHPVLCVSLASAWGLDEAVPGPNKDASPLSISSLPDCALCELDLSPLLSFGAAPSYAVCTQRLEFTCETLGRHSAPVFCSQCLPSH